MACTLCSCNKEPQENVHACGVRRIIQFNEAIEFAPLLVRDAQNINITEQCQYCWSVDGVCWCNWTSYKEYISIASNITSDFYLRILIFHSLGNIMIGDEISNCYTISIDSTNIFLKNFCDDPNLFQPYNNLDCALQLQTQLSDSIVCMLGIPIYYIKVSPQETTADYTFKEYVLHNVEDIKQMKLMIPDGQMPSSNPKLTEFDFDWETDWETELSKTQFAAAFGDTAFPKQRDFVYIPMMKRMWEVNSAYDEKNEGLMWRSTTWKLSLVKFNDSTNVDTGKFENIIDNWVTNKYEDLFGSAEKKEQERQTASLQIERPSFAATNLFDIFMEDAVRKQYTKQDVTILDKLYCNKSIVVARNLYKFRNENGCICYQKGKCGDNGTISFILETPGTLGKAMVSKEILAFGDITINVEYNENKKLFNIIFNGMECNLQPFHTYMVIIKWNRNNFTTELNIYPYTHRQDIPVYLLKPEMYWFEFDEPICELTSEYNNDFMSADEQSCIIHPYPVEITNIKYYNQALSHEDGIKESVKYTTTNKSCIINDLARPINNGHGYTIK